MTLTQVNKAGLDELALDHVFTIGASGTDHYTFQGEGLNGTVNDPTLYLTRGKTYRFENGTGAHPIRIQSTQGASGTAYNTGVTNNAGSGTVIVEVQHDAPDVLYYQCTSHANMNGVLYITGALADGGVTTAKLAADAVNGTKIADNAVAAEHIAANAVGSSELADNAVDTAAIADDAVTQPKIASNAVTTDNIANNAVTTDTIINDAVTSSKIANSQVTTAKINDQAVTLAKLEHGTSSNNGKFLRANNGADPTFETVNTDLVADTTPQLGGDLASNSHDIKFADNDKTVFGTGEDLHIFHDGSNSYVREAGTGDLYIESDSKIYIGKASGGAENGIVYNVDGSVDLYHNNSQKFATANGGATVIGNLTATSMDVATEIVHTSDTDTKLAFYDNQLEIFTAGTQALDIKSDGAMEFGHGAEISFNSNEAIRLNIPTNTDLNNAGQNRDDKGKITICGGDADNATPDADNSVIQIVPETTRSAVVGSKHGGICWQHLTPLNWNGYQGSQIWMGSSLHDTSGQERANYQIWMNNQTGQGSQPNNHAFNLSPEGYHSFPKTPIYIGEGTYYTQSTSNFTTVVPHYDLTIRGITRNGGEFTVPEDGIYCFNISALWHPGGENIYYTTALQVNGSTVGDMIQGGQTQTQHGHFNYSQLVNISASDVIRFLFKASAGAVYNGQANWSIYKVA